jgi:hypothetical protein
MAISVTEILGTDSLSGSRLVLNDNFNVLASEINAMEVYFSPSAATITGLTSLTTEALRVGISTVLLDINSSTFDISANVRILSSNLTVSGHIIRNDQSPTVLLDPAAGMPVTIAIGTSTAVPAYSTYVCRNSDGVHDLTLTLNSGVIGQELFLIYGGAYTGTVKLIGVNGNFTLPGSNSTYLTMAQLGQSVHLLAIDNGQGVPIWYVVGGAGYTVA